VGGVGVEEQGQAHVTRSQSTLLRLARCQAKAGTMLGCLLESSLGCAENCPSALMQTPPEHPGTPAQQTPRSCARLDSLAVEPPNEDHSSPVQGDLLWAGPGCEEELLERTHGGYQGRGHA